MSIEQTNVVDAIGVENQTGEVVLTISDHLEWSGCDNEHLLLLQSKINTYLSFVESGEIFEAYSNAQGRSVVIDVVCKYALSESAINFFSQVSPIVSGAGMSLRYRQFAQGTTGDTDKLTGVMA